MASPQAVQESQPLTNVVEGLRKLKAAAALQAFIAMLIAVSALLLLALLPFSTIRTGEAVAGLVCFAATVVFTIATAFAYLLPSAKRFAMWRPRDFLAPLILMRAGYTGGPLIMLVALLALTQLVRGVAPSGLAVAGVEVKFETILYACLILLLVGGVLLFTGYTGSSIHLHKLSEAFNSPQLSKIGVFVAVSGSAFTLLSASLLIIDSGIRAATAYPYNYYHAIGVAANVATAPLIIAILTSILGIAVWMQVLSEVSSIEKRVEAEGVQA
uniref:DUF973 family protein n=1 Tax=Ignisphaera aggregans TaxID=334771 RepID=A0A7C4FA57_9CREN